MSADEGGFCRNDCFALVAYLENPLARFLDDLRLRLVPGCTPHAHVTLMPPRPLSGTTEDAMIQLHHQLADFPAFELWPTDVRVFPETNVIYVDLGFGRDSAIALHQALNTGALQFQERYPYHPHITLAQNIPPVYDVEQLVRTAREAWASYNATRRIGVEELVFVHSYDQNCWTDLATIPLRQPVAVRR